ncbi:hypothetical protein FNYG_10507 [Fusarium nygamai]|uniref:C2H2-type domain-containing protein n=1 Tax=Gibberella nygamai TaxID=42673 RepID=A0A2K0W1R1_GIBNY|nr:hypothetical protein FNYG_10507 [Fusarium nygamai]
MSTITTTPNGLQTHQEYGVGLMLHDSSYYSIAPQQGKLSIKLQLLIQHLCNLSLPADFYKSKGPSKNKNQQVATKVQDEDLPLSSTGGISAATRHSNNGANGAPDVVLLFLGNHRHRHWWILHCPTVESYGSETPSIGDKRAGSPGSGNQSGGRKKRSDREINDRNNGKGNKGNGQGSGKKKRGFGPDQPFTKLACLFFKLDPQEFQRCIKFKFSRWGDVLQHLKRNHLIEGDHCPKCRKEFEGEFAEADKDEHIRQDTCVEKTALDTGLLLQNEYDDLNGLHGTPEEKWLKAWEKLFGDHPAPYSPFFETVDCRPERLPSTMARELSIILQSYRRDTLARPEVDTTPVVMDAVLRLFHPIPTPHSLVRREPQAVLVPSTPRVEDMPPSLDSEPWPDTMEPFRDITGDSYDQLDLSTGTFASQAVSDALFLPELSRELSGSDAVLYDEDENLDQWINHPEEGRYFNFEELDNNGQTLE